MKIALISDIHTKWQKLQIPKCDLLISCGDYSFRGEPKVVKDFHDWLNQQDAMHIISVQGNHETWVEKNFEEAQRIALGECPRAHFMAEGLVIIDGTKIWCSAWTPWFHAWAYNAHRGEAIKKHWDLIPDDTDILITHGPPAGILDVVYAVDGVTPRDNVGCQDLMDKILTLKKLKMHAFGHIHGSAGEKIFKGIKFINSSICDENYMPTNPVRIFEF
jgi:Icc-related predicted phosphoesterase